MAAYISEALDPIVARVFQIESITLGDAQRQYIVRYEGTLRREDTEAAYDQLASALKPLGMLPLFRKEGERQAIILVPGLPQPKPGNPLLNLVLFGLTLLSVLFTGAMYGYAGPETAEAGEYIRGVLANLGSGWPFAASLLAILLAHEFGHYLVGRFHGVHVSLPYFLPFPLSPFGTLGAFINMKEPPKNRRTLLDIGIAGPLSGLIVAVPILILGLSLSEISYLPSNPAGGLQLEGNSILYLLAKYLVFGELLPSPASYAGISPLMHWVRYYFTGQPLPFGGIDVMLHPVAWAGWAGILVTALNLIPAGQLDGGHILYVLFGSRRARMVLPFVLGGLILLGFVWSVWWVWAMLIFLLGRAHAEPLDQITQLDFRRKALGVVALVVFLLVFTPVPLVIVGI